MPFDIVSAVELLAEAASLWPVDHDGKYRDLASATTRGLVCALEPSLQREPFSIEMDEKAQFKSAKSDFVRLVSDAPIPGHPVHEALKPILSNVLTVGRGITTGTATKGQVERLVERLRTYISEHHRDNRPAA